MKKKCIVCKAEKEKKEFNKNKTRNDGLQNFCRSCDNERQRNNYQENKQYYKDKSKNQTKKLKDYANQIKKRGCSRCDEKDVVCMDFHHIKTKKDGIASLVRNAVSLDRLKKEIDKCIILCSNCHRKEHAHGAIVQGG